MVSLNRFMDDYRLDDRRLLWCGVGHICMIGVLIVSYKRHDCSTVVVARVGVVVSIGA